MSVLSVCGMGNIKGKKASSRLLSDSDQWASSSWHRVCSQWTSGDLFPRVWFTTLNCGHLISACSQRYKKTLAFARRKGVLCYNVQKEGQDVRTERRRHCKPPKISQVEQRERIIWRGTADEAVMKASKDVRHSGTFSEKLSYTTKMHNAFIPQ